MLKTLHRAMGTISNASTFGFGGFAYFFGMFLGRDIVDVELAGVGKVRLRPKNSDYRTFVQVFVQDQYDLSAFAHGAWIEDHYRRILSKGASPVIIDAGANVGATAIWFAKHFPKAKVLAVEPDDENAELLAENVKRAENVVVMKAALDGRDGAVAVLPADESWAVTTKRSGEDGASSDATVSSYSVGSIKAKAGVDAEIFIVKIDIEGFEKEVFEGDLDWIEQSPVIFIEPHDYLLPGEGTSHSFQRALMGKGFDLLIQGENLAFVRTPSKYH